MSGPDLKFVGTSEAAVWVRDTLGLDPNMVSRVVITLDAYQAATVEVTRFVTPTELNRLVVRDLHEQPSVSSPAPPVTTVLDLG